MRGILTILSQGCQWRTIDGPEASWNSVYQYYRRWVRQGVFTELFFQVELPLQGSRFFLDSTHVKVHRCASNPAGGQASQAMGTTRDGLHSEIHAVVDGAGQPVRLLLSAGHEADITHAQTMAEEIPVTMLVGDKGYENDAFCQWLLDRGIKACIPPRANRQQKRSYRTPGYRKRHLVGNFFERIKNFRHVATRYDKLADTFLGFVCLAATTVSLRAHPESSLNLVRVLAILRGGNEHYMRNLSEKQIRKARAHLREYFSESLEVVWCGYSCPHGGFFRF